MKYEMQIVHYGWNAYWGNVRPAALDCQVGLKTDAEIETRAENKAWRAEQYLILFTISNGPSMQWALRLLGGPDSTEKTELVANVRRCYSAWSGDTDGAVARFVEDWDYWK